MDLDEIGRRWAKLQEPANLTISNRYQMAWERSNLDLAELARLRWVEKWQIMKLAEHFHLSRSGIKAALRRIEANSDFCQNEPQT